MQHYVAQKTGLGKKENKQDAALQILEKLYLKGKLDDISDGIMNKKDFNSRIKEQDRAEAEETMKRFAKLSDLDQYGCYMERNSPTRYVLLQKSLFNGTDIPVINPVQKDIQLGAKQYTFTWSVSFPFPDKDKASNWFLRFRVGEF